MMDKEEVKRLAALARVGVGDEELEAFVRDASAIVAYMDRLASLKLPKGAPEPPPLQGVMREDATPHAPGRYTEALTAQFSEREGDALKVRQVISHA